jgi:YegS/Rv2252/BmrU family lipid kinase
VRVVLFANAASGSGSTAAREIVDALRGAGADVLGVLDIDAAGAGAPLPEGAQRLVVAGGDGSIAAVAALAATSGLPLAVVPTGTANDFANALDLPDALGDACQLAAAADAADRPLDLAWAGDRPFVNAAGAGLAPVAAERAGPLKRRLGPLAYAIGALHAGLTARPLRCRVVVDGATAFEGRAWQLHVGNTGAFGGGSALGEPVDPADGRLDVAVVTAGPRAALVRRAWAMRSGRLVDDDAVAHGQGARIEVALGRDARFNVDGELCGLGEHVAFSVAPAAFRVVVRR